MIIKLADNKQAQIKLLESLLTRPDASSEIRKRIEQEIRNIKAGVRGENEAAYEMEFEYRESKNWMLIHDLRIQCAGRVAQIDHIVINRFMDVWVCESKNFSEGVSINENGEFTAFYGGKPYGLPSPIEQNRKHIDVLESVFRTGQVKLPTRLGFNIKPAINSLILVSKNARISRPKAKLDGIDSVIKNDQFKATIDKSLNTDINPLTVARFISSETLEEFSRSLTAIHRPIEFDWYAKFGLAKLPPAITTLTQPLPAAKISEPAETAAPKNDDKEKPKQKLICHSCSETVSYAIAKFCWFNKPKFNGNVYCMECQKKV